MCVCVCVCVCVQYSQHSCIILHPPGCTLSLSIYTAVNLSGTTSTGSSSDLSSVPTSKSDPTVSSKPTKAARRKRRPSSAEGLGGLRKQGASTVAGTCLRLHIHSNGTRMFMQYIPVHIICIIILCNIVCVYALASLSMQSYTLYC